MKKLVLFLILLTGCATTEVAITPDTPPTEAEIRQQREAESYDYACLMMSDLFQYDACAHMDPPQVIWTQLPAAVRAYGVYIPGEPYVFVDPLGNHVWTTVIHEMTHYIAYWNSIDDRCISEELARYVAGQPGEWRTRYGCVKET